MLCYHLVLNYPPVDIMD